MTGIVSAALSMTSSICLRIILCKCGIQFQNYIYYLKKKKNLRSYSPGVQQQPDQTPDHSGRSCGACDSAAPNVLSGIAAGFYLLEITDNKGRETFLVVVH
jgi:hypothetical protein